MDNATYDELNLTPITTDETYSRLRTNETKIKPSYELQRRAGKNATKETQQINSSNNTILNTVMVIMMIILLLISLTSITLSVTTFN